MTEHERVFSSFWMAGFESACHITRQGIRLDMIHATQHDHFIEQDYANLANVGISSVRDTVRWHLVESNAGRFDFSSMNPMLEAAARHGIQVVWNLCHYGWPKTIDLMDPAFIERFARFAGAVSEHVRDHSSAVPLYTPINEISFFAWAAGEVGWFYPYGKGRGGELKRQLIRACIAGINAIWDVDPRARIVIVDPSSTSWRLRGNRSLRPKRRPTETVSSKRATCSQAHSARSLVASLGTSTSWA